MTLLETILGMLGVIGSVLTFGVVFLGIPWALYTLARVARVSDETLRVQREILRELRRGRANPVPEESSGNEPKQAMR